MRLSFAFAHALPLLFLAGCQSAQAPAGKAAAPTATAAPVAAAAAAANAAPAFIDRALGVSLAAVAGMQVHRDFARSYLDNGAWKAYAAPDSQGSPLVALVMDGSNHIITAELRIGTSSDGAALRDCSAVPDSASPESTSTVLLDGVAFRHFRAADAAMSHYMQVEGYRAVHQGRCIAIDLLLTGTNPDAYPEPPALPFTRAQAWEKLHEALAAVHFTH